MYFLCFVTILKGCEGRQTHEDLHMRVPIESKGNWRDDDGTSNWMKFEKIFRKPSTVFVVGREFEAGEGMKIERKWVSTTFRRSHSKDFRERAEFSRYFSPSQGCARFSKFAFGFPPKNQTAFRQSVDERLLEKSSIPIAWKLCWNHVQFVN